MPAIKIESDAQRPAATKGWFVILEVLAFAALAFGSRLVFAQFAWAFSGPLSLLLTLIALTIYMRARGIGWRDMGLVRLPGWKAKLLVPLKSLLVFAFFAAAVSIVMFGGEAIGFTRGDIGGVEQRFGGVEGNPAMLALWLFLAWTSAAFGEEMFFRGYMVTRLMDGLEGIPGRMLISILLPGFIFGYGHFYYQGFYGLVMTMFIGMAFCIAFLLLRRNLWPIVLVHGTVDSIAFIATYLGQT